MQIFFKNDSFSKNASFYKVCRLVNDNPSLTIVKSFLKVQNEWVFLKKNCFFPKTKLSFLKTIGKRNKKHLKTLPMMTLSYRIQKRIYPEYPSILSQY